MKSAALAGPSWAAPLCHRTPRQSLHPHHPLSRYLCLWRRGGGRGQAHVPHIQNVPPLILHPPPPLPGSPFLTILTVLRTGRGDSLCFVVNHAGSLMHAPSLLLSGHVSALHQKSNDVPHFPTVAKGSQQVRPVRIHLHLGQEFVAIPFPSTIDSVDPLQLPQDIRKYVLILVTNNDVTTLYYI